MIFWERIKHLLPSNRRAQERDMQEELESLGSMAEPRELGSLALVAEDAREVWTWSWLEHLSQDVRYAFRSMLQNKSFTALAVLSLALGIGANTAIYSFMDSILFTQLPVPHPETLVVMKWRTPKGFTSAASKGMSWSTDGSYVTPDGGYVGTSFPYPALKLFQDNSSVLSSAFCYFGTRLSVSLNGEAEELKGQYVSGNYFLGMGVAPATGRLIVDDDDGGGTNAVAVLSYRFSQRRFGTIQQSIGQPIRINNNVFTVIGVAPSDFFGAEPGAVPDIYVPLHAQHILQPTWFMLGEQYLTPNFYWLEIMARLKPGITLEQAQATVAPQFRRFVDESTTTERQRSNPPTLTIEQGGAGLDNLRRRFAQPIYLLMTMVGLILVIACANIANLLLARSVARRREFAVRLSIGAGRIRLVRQLLTESFLLASIGGMIGIAFAAWGIRVLTLLLANGRENFTLHAQLDWHVLAVTAALSFATGLFFGVVPAIHATRVDVMPALKELRADACSGRANRIWRRVGLSHMLIVAQIAISLVLLVGAGLFVRTVSKLHSIELGFTRDNILLFNVHGAEAGYTGPAANRLYEDLRQRLKQVPGIRSVSFSSAPLPSGGGSKAPVSIAGTEAAASAEGHPSNLAALFWVGPFFFDTMQIPLIAGREFTERDTDGESRVVIINRSLARVFGLGDHPVGRSLTLGKNTYEIIGLVRDALAFNLKDALAPVVYFPSLQDKAAGTISFEVRAANRPLALAPEVRQMMRQIDSRVAVSDMKTEAAHIDEAISSEIALARLCTVFAALALTIATIGLYGTVSFNVVRRTAEIGIRMALGARAGQMLWMILREVWVVGVMGVLAGAPLVVAESRFLKSFLYGIEPNDSIAIAIAVAILLLAGLAAAYFPARRAAKADPMIALRCE